MRYSSKSGFWAVAVLLSGAAAFGSACGGSGSRNDSPPSGAGATGVPGAGATGVPGAGATGVPGGGATGFAGTSSGTGGGGAACDPATMCCTSAKCPCPYPAGAAANMTIADMEASSTMFKTATVMTANGYWDWSNDGTGMVTPASTATLMTSAPGANGTGMALHVTATGHTGWGAALAAELSNGCPFDASAYGGISFYAKGTSTVLEGMNKLLVLVGMPEFIPTENGGFCNDTVMPPDMNCYARHRVQIDLTPDWKQYTIAWKDLAPPTYLVGGPMFNPNRIRDIVFNASGPSPAMTPAATFDFSVDELKFVPVGTMGTVGGGAGGASGTAGAAATAGAGGASAGASGTAAGAGGAAAGSGGTGGA
jgi:hypothetical protein